MGEETGASRSVKAVQLPPGATAQSRRLGAARGVRRELRVAPTERKSADRRMRRRGNGVAPEPRPPASERGRSTSRNEPRMTGDTEHSRPGPVAGDAKLRGGRASGGVIPQGNNDSRESWRRSSLRPRPPRGLPDSQDGARKALSRLMSLDLRRSSSRRPVAKRQHRQPILQEREAVKELSFTRPSSRLLLDRRDQPRSPKTQRRCSRRAGAQRTTFGGRGRCRCRFSCSRTQNR